MSMKPLLLVLIFFVLAGDKIRIENAWLRPSSRGFNSALYFDVKNGTDFPDTLYKVESDLAKLVQIHETYKKGDKMGMREVKKVGIKPHSIFSFKPGGHHIMLIKLQKDLKEKSSGEVTLYFKSAGKIKLKVPVKKG